MHEDIARYTISYINSKIHAYSDLGHSYTLVRHMSVLTPKKLAGCFQRDLLCMHEDT